MTAAGVPATDDSGRAHTAECFEHGCTNGRHPAPRPGHVTGGPWTPEEIIARGPVTVADDSGRGACECGHIPGRHRARGTGPCYASGRGTPVCPCMSFTPARPGTADELREEAGRALFEHDHPNLYYETAGVKAHIEYAQRADAVLATDGVQRLLAVEQRVRDLADALGAEAMTGVTIERAVTSLRIYRALGGGDDA